MCDRSCTRYSAIILKAHKLRNDAQPLVILDDPASHAAARYMVAQAMLLEAAVSIMASADSICGIPHALSCPQTAPHTPCTP
jgi:hypothetical protein